MPLLQRHVNHTFLYDNLLTLNDEESSYICFQEKVASFSSVDSIADCMALRCLYPACRAWVATKWLSSSAKSTPGDRFPRETPSLK